MRELNAAVAAWRRELERAGLTSGPALDELEDHLFCAIEHRVAEGFPPGEAFRDAAHAVGDASTLAAAYHRASHPMNLATKLFGTLLSLALIALAAGSAAGGVSVFVHAPALLLVLGLVLGGLWAGFGLPDTLAALRAGLAQVPEPDPARRARFLAISRRGYHLAWASGALGTLLGAIVLLSNLDDPARIGPGLALCLLALLYGALLAELLFASMRAWLGVEPAASR